MAALTFRTKLIGLSIVVMLAAGMWLVAARKPATQTATTEAKVHIQYSLGDVAELADVSLVVDGAAVDPLEDLSLVNGTHAISITKPGFSTFSSSVKTIGKPVTVYASLKPTKDSTLSSLAMVSGLNLGKQFSLGSVTHFYDKTWAFVIVTSKITDPAIIIAHYNAPKGTWDAVLGPGTAYSPEDMWLVPDLVKQYTIKTGYAPKEL